MSDAGSLVITTKVFLKIQSFLC